MSCMQHKSLKKDKERNLNYEKKEKSEEQKFHARGTPYRCGNYSHFGITSSAGLEIGSQQIKSHNLSLRNETAQLGSTELS